MRYLSLAVAVFCAVMLFVSDSPTVLGLCLLGVGVFGLIAVFAFAQARINSNPQSNVAILSPKELAEMRQRAASKKPAAGPGAQPQRAGTAGTSNDPD